MQNLKSKILGSGLALTLGALPFAAHADPAADIFGGISFTAVAAAVVVVALVSMGIATAFKAWGLGKKAVNRV